MFSYSTLPCFVPQFNFSCSQSPKLHPNTDAIFYSYFFLIYFKSSMSHDYKSPSFLSLTAALLLAAFPRDIPQLHTLKALTSVCFAVFNIHLLKHLLFIFHCMILSHSPAICCVCASAVYFSSTVNSG